MRSSVTLSNQSKVATPPHQKESVDAVQDPDKDSSWARCARHAHLGGGLGVDPGHAGEYAPSAPLNKLDEVTGEKEVCTSLLTLLPL